MLTGSTPWSSTVEEHLAAYRITEAARAVTDFTDMLSQLVRAPGPRATGGSE